MGSSMQYVCSTVRKVTGIHFRGSSKGCLLRNVPAVYLPGGGQLPNPTGKAIHNEQFLCHVHHWQREASSPFQRASFVTRKGKLFHNPRLEAGGWREWRSWRRTSDSPSSASLRPLFPVPLRPAPLLPVEIIVPPLPLSKCCSSSLVVLDVAVSAAAVDPGGNRSREGVGRSPSWTRPPPCGRTRGCLRALLPPPLPPRRLPDTSFRAPFLLQFLPLHISLLRTILSSRAPVAATSFVI